MAETGGKESRIGYRMREALACHGLSSASVALLLVFVYLPVCWAFVSSLYEFEIGAEARFIGLGNYREMLFSDPVIRPSFINMALLTLIAVAIRLTVPLVVAKLIHSLPGERERYFYRVLFLVPIVVPGVAVQMIWGGLVYADRGLLNELLTAAGLQEWTAGWLNDPKTALAAFAMIGFPFAGGMEILIYFAGLSSIPQSVNEAAAMEGCTGLRKFLYIDVPMVMSQLKLILILTIIGGVQSYEALFVLTKGGPGFTTTVPALWMYYNAFSFQRMGYACAIGVGLFCIVFALTALNLRYFKSSADLEGPK